MTKVKKIITKDNATVLLHRNWKIRAIFVISVAIISAVIISLNTKESIDMAEEVKKYQGKEFSIDFGIDSVSQPVLYEVIKKSTQNNYLVLLYDSDDIKSKDFIKKYHTKEIANLKWQWTLEEEPKNNQVKIILHTNEGINIRLVGSIPDSLTCDNSFLKLNIQKNKGDFKIITDYTSYRKYYSSKILIQITFIMVIPFVISVIMMVLIIIISSIYKNKIIKKLQSQGYELHKIFSINESFMGIDSINYFLNTEPVFSERTITGYINLNDSNIYLHFIVWHRSVILYVKENK